MPVRVEHKWMVPMKFRKSTDSVRRKEFVFIENVSVDTLKFLAIGNGEEQAGALVGFLAHVHVLADFGIVIQEPLHPFAEIRQSLQNLRFEGFGAKERNQADHRSNLH